MNMEKKKKDAKDADMRLLEYFNILMQFKLLKLLLHKYWGSADTR